MVLYHLQNQRASLYFGMSFDEILRHITKNEAFRYLSELAILAAAQRKPLDQIRDNCSVDELGSSISFRESFDD